MAATIRIAQAFNISIDYLEIDTMRRRPLRVDDDGLGERLGTLSELEQTDRDSLLNLVDALITACAPCTHSDSSSWDKARTSATREQEMVLASRYRQH